MPLNQKPLELPPDPKSVSLARHWVRERFVALGREDLLECAELAASELLTNALLHARDPIAIRLRGTRAHPRVEVTDGSTQPPLLPGPPSSDLDDLLSTFGRGLDIVARCSVAWGATIERDGKVVWFEPATEPHEDVPPLGAIYDEAAGAEQPETGSRVRVSLRSMPVATLLGLRRHNADLRRELRLLSFAHSDTYPLATEITDLFARFDANWPDTLREASDRAAAEGVEVIDVDVKVARAALPLLEQMRDLFALADQFCAAQRLLTLARSPHQRRFQDWLIGEFVRQADGAEPLAWSGPEPGRQYSAL